VLVVFLNFGKCKDILGLTLEASTERGTVGGLRQIWQFSGIGQRNTSAQDRAFVMPQVYTLPQLNRSQPNEWLDTSLLREQVAAMPPDNFLVRAKRRLVEKYSDQEAWNQLGVLEQGELVREVAALPSTVADSDQDAKQFDLLMLSLHLTVLRVDAMRLDAPGAALLIAIHR